MATKRKPSKKATKRESATLTTKDRKRATNAKAKGSTTTRATAKSARKPVHVMPARQPRAPRSLIPNVKTARPHPARGRGTFPSASSTNVERTAALKSAAKARSPKAKSALVPPKKKVATVKATSRKPSPAKAPTRTRQTRAQATPRKPTKARPNAVKPRVPPTSPRSGSAGAPPGTKKAPRRPVAKPAPKKAPKLTPKQQRAARSANAGRAALPKGSAKSRSASAKKGAATRKRNALDRQGIRDALAAEKAAKAERAKATRARKRAHRRGVTIVDERKQAEGWLQWIRNDIATEYPVTMDPTEPAGGDAKMPWLIVGRFEFLQEMSYEAFGHALDIVRNDLFLEAAISPQRLSQIRVVYEDPNAKRGESDSIISKLGAWEFILSDLIAEILGGGPDDEGALAVRYEATIVKRFYIYFSVETLTYRSAASWMKTESVSVR